MKITKKIREEAANICSMRASEWVIYYDNYPNGPYPPLIGSYPCSAAAIELADKAFCEIPTIPTLDYQFNYDAWAEAEAMLREGWEPK